MVRSKAKQGKFDAQNAPPMPMKQQRVAAASALEVGDIVTIQGQGFEAFGALFVVKTDKVTDQDSLNGSVSNDIQLTLKACTKSVQLVSTYTRASAVDIAVVQKVKTHAASNAAVAASRTTSPAGELVGGGPVSEKPPAAEGLAAKSPTPEVPAATIARDPTEEPAAEAPALEAPAPKSPLPDEKAIAAPAAAAEAAAAPMAGPPTDYVIVGSAVELSLKGLGPGFKAVVIDDDGKKVVQITDVPEEAHAHVKQFHMGLKLSLDDGSCEIVPKGSPVTKVCDVPELPVALEEPSPIVTFSEYLRSRKDYLPKALNIGPTPNSCKGHNPGTWHRGLSKIHVDDEYFIESYNNHIAVPESRAKLFSTQAERAALSVPGAVDRRTTALVEGSRWGLSSFADNPIGDQVFVFCTGYFNARCFESGGNGEPRGITSERRSDGIHEGLVRYLQNGKAAYICSILIAEDSPVSPFTTMVLVVLLDEHKKVGTKAALVSSTSIMAFGDERSKGLLSSQVGTYV